MAKTDTQKPTKIQLIILLAVAVLCFGLGSGYGRSQQRGEQAAAALLSPLLEEQETPAALPPAAPPEKEKPALLAVHVKGAVEQPGVYELAEGSRVADALALAGLQETANTDIINLALTLADSMEIIIPFRLEDEETDWQALAEESAAAMYSGSIGNEAASAKSTGPVNINSASLNQLQTLTGIGPAKAQAIIDYREQHGAFARIEDIKKVSGIGDATFAKIKERICVE